MVTLSTPYLVPILIWMMSRDFYLNFNQIALICTLLDTPRSLLKDPWVSPPALKASLRRQACGISNTPLPPSLTNVKAILLSSKKNKFYTEKYII